MKKGWNGFMEEKVLSAEPQPDLRRRRTGSSSSWISLMGMDMRRHALRWEKTEIKKKKKKKKKRKKEKKLQYFQLKLQ